MYSGGSKTVQNRQEKFRFGRQPERQTHLSEIPVMGRLFQHYHLKKIYWQHDSSCQKTQLF